MQTYNITVQNMFNNNLYSDDYLFYACILSKCELKIDNEMPSPAAVSYDNKYILHINLDMFGKFTLEERLAILKHEMLHILNGHLSIRTLEGKIANISYDCAINQLINKNHLPKDCVDVLYIKTILKKNNINIKVNYNEPSEYYYNLLKQLPNNCEIKDINNHNWESSGDSDNQMKETYDMIEEAIETTNKIIGNTPNECDKWLKLHQTKSKINWKKYIKNLIKSNKYKKTIFKRNRRTPDRLDTKGKIKNNTCIILYIIDSSGSVTDKTFKKLNSEIISLCTQNDVDVISIQVDTEASEPEILTKRTKKINRKRDAGTFLSAGLIKAEERKINYNFILVSTDGYLHNSDIHNFMKINKNIIFLIPKNGVDNFTKLNKKNIKCIMIE